LGLLEFSIAIAIFLIYRAHTKPEIQMLRRWASITAYDFESLHAGRMLHLLHLGADVAGKPAARPTFALISIF